MKYTFKREDKVNLEAWDRTNRSLWKTRDAAVRGEFGEADMTDYCRQAVRDARPLSHDPKMMFWGYDEPDEMPSDARCQFFYLPTYLIVQTMIVGINRYPHLLDIPGIRDVLSRALFGCTGRGLHGSGYDAMVILLENLTMFTDAGIQKFLREHPDIGGPFGEMYEELIAQVREDYDNGRHVFDWNCDFKKEQAELLALYDSKGKELP